MKNSLKVRISRRKAIGLLGASVTGVGIGQIGDRDDIRTEHVNLHLQNWSADGVKVVLLTDLHMDSASKAARAVRATEIALSHNPDLLLIGGDIVSTSHPDGLAECYGALDAILDTRVPVCAVLGNHEYQTRNPAQIISDLTVRFKKHGKSLLHNEVAEVQGVIVNGIDDGLAHRDKHDRLKDKHDKNVITLFHEPDFVSRIDKRSSLMLSGHSHGGQVCLPFGVSLLTPNGALKYIKGYYPFADVPLYVSRGIGTVGPSLRAFCPPEVTVFRLQGA